MSDQNEQDKQPITQTQAVVKAPTREMRVVHDDSSLAYMLDTARFDHTYRIAGAMARASLIPKHLKGDSFEQTQANCFLVVNQSLRWGLDPFIVAPETYEVGGKLGFQGKLVAAVINSRGNLEERLTYSFNDGKGDALEVTVSGRIKGESQPRTVTVSVGQARTTNQMWTKDPHQKLIYTGAIKWARRHLPEIILGVVSDDDAEAIREEARFHAATPVKTPQFSGMDAAQPGTEATIAAPEPPKKRRTEKVTPAPATEVKAEVVKPENVTPMPETVTPQPEPPKAVTPPQPTDPADDLFDEGETKTPTQLDELLRLMSEKGITPYSMLGFCGEKKLFKAEAQPPYGMKDIKEEKLVTLCQHVGSGSKTCEAIKNWKPVSAQPAA